VGVFLWEVFGRISVISTIALGCYQLTTGYWWSYADDNYLLQWLWI